MILDAFATDALSAAGLIAAITSLLIRFYIALSHSKSICLGLSHIFVRDPEIVGKFVYDGMPDGLFYIILGTAGTLDVIFEYSYLVRQDISVKMRPL